MELCHPAEILEVLEQAAVLNRLDPCREGHLMTLPDYGQVIMTGDLHGCVHNFEKLRWFADLERCIHRHVIIHELIHSNGFTPMIDEPLIEDSSSLLLVEAAKWKIEFPEQVHFLLGNHDLAQITAREITKGGMSSIANFNKWILEQYGNSEGQAILERVREFLISLPLAAKCPNRIWLSHSLPNPLAMDNYDFSIFNREWETKDLWPRGSVYETVWGRNHSDQQLEELAELLNVDYFILGHQRQEEGFKTQAQRLIILASDHSRGCYMPIDLSKKYAFDDLSSRIQFFHDLPQTTS